MSSDYPFSSRVIVDPEVLFRVVGNETVILNLKTEKYLGLNDTGTRMWTALAEATTIQEAYDALLLEFAVGGDELRQDMVAFIGSLLEQRLIEIAPA